MFLGVEFVRDRQTREPAGDVAQQVVEQMRELGVLLSVDGPRHNVIKIKPPLVVNQGDIDRTLRSLERVLAKVL